MRLYNPWMLLGSFLLPALAVDTSKYSQSVTLSYEIVGTGSSAKPLAEVLYDPTTLKSHIASWTPPSTDNSKSTTSASSSSTQLVRVLLPDGSSTVTSLTSFSSTLSQDINLWLSPIDNKIFSASITSISPPPLTDEEKRQQRKIERAIARGKPLPSSKPTNPKKVKQDLEPETKGPTVKVQITRTRDGVRPKLLSRKPPPVDSEGREIVIEEQPEKSFFQKYWWVFLIGMFLVIGGGGGDGK